MSNEEERDHEQQDSDEESLEGNWESKSEASSPSSSTSNEENQPSQPADRLEPELLNYLLEHKADLNLDTIKAVHRVATKLTQSKSGKSLEECLNNLLLVEKSDEQELELSRKEAEKAKCKARLLQEQLKKELSSFDKLKVDNILKNSGGSEYVESLKSIIKVKESTIKSQAMDIKHLERDNESLHERLKRANKLNDDQRRALQQAQAKSTDFELDRRRNLSHQGSVTLGSPEPQFDSSHGYHIPPPPLVEGDEILRLVSSPQDPQMTSANSSTYNGLSFLNNSIPPPPHFEVSLDEILSDMNGSNMVQEQRFSGPHA